MCIDQSRTDLKPADIDSFISLFPDPRSDLHYLIIFDKHIPFEWFRACSVIYNSVFEQNLHIFPFLLNPSSLRPTGSVCFSLSIIPYSAPLL